MDELYPILDKLFTEVDHLERVTDHEDAEVELALSVAKRVRRQSSLLVRELAALRDEATA